MYNRFFLLNKPMVSYTIRFKDLLKVWERLKVDNNFVILSVGVYLGTFSDLHGKHANFKYAEGEGSFNGEKIFGLQSAMRAFIIVPKESLPYFEHVTLAPVHNESEKKLLENLHCIDEVGCLYSNVDSLDAQKNRLLSVLRKVKLISKKHFTKYILLKIEYSNDSSWFDLDKIQGIENYISLSHKSQ